LLGTESLSAKFKLVRNNWLIFNKLMPSSTDIAPILNIQSLKSTDVKSI